MKRAAIRWWQPELWLVLVLPAAALAGGVLTLRAVNVDLSVDGAEAGASRTAQVQTAQLAPDLAAARSAMQGDLQVDQARGEVRLRLPVGAASPGLQLQFVHPLLADRDLVVHLRRRGDEWVAPLAPATGIRWRVVLTDASRSWRLVGTLLPEQGRLRLRPALDAQ